MAAVTICSDFGAQENKVCHCFHCLPISLPWGRIKHPHPAELGSGQVTCLPHEDEKCNTSGGGLRARLSFSPHPPYLHLPRSPRGYNSRGLRPACSDTLQEWEKCCAVSPWGRRWLHHLTSSPHRYGGNPGKDATDDLWKEKEACIGFQDCTTRVNSFDPLFCSLAIFTHGHYSSWYFTNLARGPPAFLSLINRRVKGTSWLPQKDYYFQHSSRSVLNDTAITIKHKEGHISVTHYPALASLGDPLPPRGSKVRSSSK